MAFRAEPITEDGSQIDESAEHVALAREAARRIWNEDPSASELPDPMNEAFALEFVRALDEHLRSAGPLMHRVLKGASRSAEGTNVEPFHGIVEVVQNADDQRAGEVRLMLRDGPRGRQMLIVHDGRPVTFHHVGGMMLPYVTTKEDDADQRGRFGIGLKTLRRISDAVAVHGGPYHFGSGDEISIRHVAAEPPIPSFYDATSQTMLVLDLVDFDEAEFTSWFGGWSDDALIFLDHVRRFSWHQDEQVLAKRTLASGWSEAGSMPNGTVLERRTVAAGATTWTVHRANVPVPADRQRAYKRTASVTPISVAHCGQRQLLGLFVGLRTRVPTSCPFAIDAQFDPSSSRESILDNQWNSWLIEGVGEVLSSAAVSMLLEDARQAWQLVPLGSDTVGDAGTKWPREAFAASLRKARDLFAEHARFVGADHTFGLDQIAYEAEEFTGFLAPEDVTELTARPAYLESDFRDDAHRWRAVLKLVGRAACLDVSGLLDGVAKDGLQDKPADWWVELASIVTAEADPKLLLGRPFWLLENGSLGAAQPANGTCRLLVRTDRLSTFARSSDLFDLLHPEFSSEQGKASLEWLSQHAAFSPGPSGSDELRAFAERHRDSPIRPDDATLQELRGLLDPITGNTAAEIGALLGKAILIEASEGRRSTAVKWVSARETYLPKAIDKDSPNWPNAAAGLGAMLWAVPSYEDRLRTGLGRMRKREDGVIPRGARKFLSLLGVASSPRLLERKHGSPRTQTQNVALSAADANDIKSDWGSPDLEQVLAAITGTKGRLPIRERRERASSLLRCLAREWPRYAQLATVPSVKHARVYTHPRGAVPAHWICLLREAEWVPVGRSGLRRPSDAVLRNPSTEAVYAAGDFVAGVDSSEVPVDLAEALGLIRKVRASDVIRSLEQMRAGAEPFDRAKVHQSYRQLDRLVPKESWSPLGDLKAHEVRARFDGGGGLVVVDDQGSRPVWRRPGQVLRGKRILPVNARYVPDADRCERLWAYLMISETGVDDCCSYLKERAEAADPDEDAGTLIEVYGNLNAMLSKAEAVGAERVRHIPLACGGAWRARRPIYLVEQQDLRAGLARALPDRHFWDPPCRTSSITNLVASLGLTRLDPLVEPIPTQYAAERGEDLATRFAEAVSHLSDQLARTSIGIRDDLSVGWDELRSMRVLVYDGDVPVTVIDPALPEPVETSLRVHLSRKGMELHVAEDAIGARDGAGRAIASLFKNPTRLNFDAEWALAWQEAERRGADHLRFRRDEEEHQRKLKEEAARIAGGEGRKTAVRVGTAPAAGPAPATSPPLPPRQLKTQIGGVGSVTVVGGKPPQPPRQPSGGPLRNEPEVRNRVQPHGANAAYSNQELENLGWQVVCDALAGSDKQQLVDFRNRQRVGADGAIDWRRFVELKACGRSMPSSVQLTVAEFTRAVERGQDYLLVLVSGLEQGCETKIKVILDPVRSATVSKAESIRLSGLIDAAGIELTVPDPS